MRDDFTDEVKRILAARTGNACSNPDCRAVTSGPQNDPTKAVNVGVAAHITAAAEGGTVQSRYFLSGAPTPSQWHLALPDMRKAGRQRLVAFHGTALAGMENNRRRPRFQLHRQDCDSSRENLNRSESFGAIMPFKGQMITLSQVNSEQRSSCWVESQAVRPQPYSTAQNFM